MKEDKLIRLALDLTNRLKMNIQKSIFKQKSLLNRSRELDERMLEFDETTNLLSDL